MISLLPDLYNKLPEPVKPFGYNSDEYLDKLDLVNSILSSCDLKAR